MENYEQKYKRALEKARQLCAYPTTKPFISDLQDLFPELLDNIDTLEYEKTRKEMLKEAACEDFEKAAQAYSNLYNDECFEDIVYECPYIKNAFKAGANWQKESLWKPADGDNLPKKEE